MTFDEWWEKQPAQYGAYQNAKRGWDAALKHSGYVSREETIRQCWEAINAQIKLGELPGYGCDQQSQRNGMVLASNILAEMMGWPKAKYAEDIK